MPCPDQNLIHEPPFFTRFAMPRKTGEVFYRAILAPAYREAIGGLIVRSPDRRRAEDDVASAIMELEMHRVDQGEPPLPSVERWEVRPLTRAEVDAWRWEDAERDPFKRTLSHVEDIAF